MDHSREVTTLSGLIRSVLIGTLLLAVWSPVLAGATEQRIEGDESASFLDQQEAQPFPDSTAPEGEVPNLMNTALKMSGALIIIIGVLLVVSYGARRVMNQRGPLLGKEQLIQVVSTRYLGSKQTLSVIEIQGQRLVIGVSPQGMTFLTRLYGETEQAKPGDRGASFKKVLQERIDGR